MITIRKLLETADITQQEFADMIGVSRVAINKLLSNGNLDRIIIAREMLNELVRQQKLPRGYARTDSGSRTALVGKLKAKLDTLVAL